MEDDLTMEGQAMTDEERKRIFSKNLVNILNERSKTQIEVAKAIGVSQQTFNTWCRGIALPRMGKVQLLADYFNIKMSELLEDSPGASEPSIDPDRLQLLKLYDSLNDDGMKRLIEYALLLSSSGVFKEHNSKEDSD